jgi:hypothetical protein
MTILNFILLYWDSVLLVLALITVLIVLYVRGEKKILNHIMFAAITEAERQYGSGTGPLKKASVIAKIYSILPFVLKILINESQIARWIESALTCAKKTWGENAAIGELVSEDTAEAVTDKPPGIDTDFASGKYII